MSAVTQNNYTGNGSTTTYSFTFPYLKTSDIKASLDGVDTTAFTLPNATTIQFNTAPSNGVQIKIFRETGVDNLTATFYAGSAIKSEDLNDNFTQNLYKTQEVGQRALSTLGGTMTGTLNMGEDTTIVFEGATDNAHETTLTVTDPTADRTITLPNVTGTVVTTGDTGTVTSTMITDGTIVNADVNTSAAIEGSKLQVSSGSNAGTMSAANFTKLAGIETAATADQTNAEIKTAYEANSNTNAYTDTEKTFVNAITATATELNILDGVTATATELNIMDGVTATTTELNLMDGGSTVGTTAVADGDGIVTNDGGTMRQTNVTTFATYFSNEITSMTSLVTTGALNGGSITSGFGSIDNGSSTITTTGTITGGNVTLGSGGVADTSAGELKITPVTEEGSVESSTSGTINVDCDSKGVIFFNVAQTANRTINFRGDGSTTLNAYMSDNDVITISVMMTQTGSAYYLNAVQIDGSSVTPEWQGGTAPSAGNANSVDVYSFTIFKTGSAAYTVLASQVQFA